MENGTCGNREVALPSGIWISIYWFVHVFFVYFPVTPWSQHHPCLSTGITMLNRGRERRGVGWLRLVAPAAAT
ncbi:hypothetical protein QQP08_005477 [Theobroma cacao]|nr:hypothetical protein QQP08_005477 [Theobroma cacao]